MSNSIQKHIKNTGSNLIIIIIFIVATALTANAFQSQKPAPTTFQTTTNSPDYIETIAKILSIDPVKGDVTVRLEFFPHGNFVKEDGTLARNVKFDINSSNGKQEISFEKGKRMTPTEAVLNMYDGSIADYPFDKHEANLAFWFTAKPDKPADKPKPAEEAPTGETKPETKPETENADEEDEIPFTLEFNPSMAGYNIETSKSKDSDDTYVDVEMKISRSSLVVSFAVFVMILMWGVSIAVLFLIFTVVVKGRKVEIAMFSFLATVIFAFITLRNNQPGNPPIGTLSDYYSFFWAIVILSLSLLTIISTWLLRPAAK